MAPWVKVLIVASTVLAVAWAIPPRRLSFPGPAGPSDGRSQELHRLAGEISRIRGTLKQRAITESVDMSGGFSVLAMEFPAGPPELEEIRAVAEEAVETVGNAYGIARPGAGLAMVFTPRALIQRDNDLPWGSRVDRSESWLVTGPERETTCWVHVPLRDVREFENQVSRWGTAPILERLGSCLFPYWFGEPGLGVGAWYATRGHSLAHRVPGTRPWNDTERRTRLAFGKRRSWGWSHSVASDACRAGRRQDCRDAVLGPAPVSGLPESGGTVAMGQMGPGFSETFFSGHGRYLLFDLLDEFGPGRFQEFWSSQEEPSRAFEAAFGTPTAEWVHEWAVARLGPEPNGPRLSGMETAGVLLLLGGFGGLGAARARRRRIG